jgi:hypothetical protein
VRIRTLSIGIALLSCSALLYAQQGLLGTYKAWYKTGQLGHKQSNSATLEITSAENGKIAGKLTISGECDGDYVIAGTYQDSKLEMLTSEGALRGCGKETLLFVAQGNKLVGTMGAEKIEFERK